MAAAVGQPGSISIQILFLMARVNMYPNRTNVLLSKNRLDFLAVGVGRCSSNIHICSCGSDPI